MLGTNATYNIEKCGFFTPKIEYVNELKVGQIGFFTAGIKHVSDCKIGDTITDEKLPIQNR